MKAPLLIALATLLSGPTAGAQECSRQITPTAPDSRYELLNQGAEVLDHQTRLVWQRCPAGMRWSGQSCEGSAKTMMWIDALQSARQAGPGWRLPNIKELRSLVERSCREPALNTTLFPMSGNIGYAFWSSTSDGETSIGAMTFDFVLGKLEETSKDNDEPFVRLVRYP
ncbi:MAG: DUF1566 domain-containing protein [Fluviicoccus sp.]|uniref:Lcl C-terminal domain-containing protein n=1 Tax=Fluviicoccus sp. TaxID=2003552 RepID=UPI002719FC85|nr:DUF1566 domain-containing protein [Fluviicoccus sp.]MDO8329639.1 DUF1566 domain-containing protein [Fluviicoccus sp.]